MFPDSTAALPERKRPTFHEIRGLASRRMKDLGLSTDAISGLMIHADKKTTQIYLERDVEALRDENYRTVKAPFTLAEMLG